MKHKKILFGIVLLFMLLITVNSAMAETQYMYEVGSDTDKIYQWSLSSDWDLSSASYDSVSIDTQDSGPKGFFFKHDGTKMYEIGSTDNKVYQYSLSSAWNLSSASYDSVSISTQSTGPRGMFFKPDGTKMYEVGKNNEKIYQWSLSSAWNLSTASYDSASIDTQGGYPVGIFFKPDGTKMYEIGGVDDKVYQYSLSSAWDLSSASYDSVNIDTPGGPEGIFFKPDGTKMYIVGYDGNIYQYSLSSAWNLSSASYDSVSIDTQDGDPNGVFFRNVVEEEKNISITSTYPANNTQFNTEELNISVLVTTTNTSTCNLYINDVLNQTNNSINNGNDVNVTFNVPFANDTESNYTYYVNCSINSNTSIYDNTSTNTFYIDNEFPILSWTKPRDDEKFVLNEQNPNFVTSITIADDNLYSYEYNITNMSGTNLFSFSNSSLTGLTSYTINDSVNMSGYTGVFNATVEVCDGHTNKKIKSIKNIVKRNDKIEFLDNKENVKIKIKDSYNARTTNTFKEKDRYKFSFETKVKKNQETFKVNSDQYIDILHGKTKYEGHLITGKRWIDFEKKGVQVTNIKRISDTEVEVTARSKNPISDWTFNSIGELNCDIESKLFYVTGIEELTPDVALTSDTIEFELDITDFNRTCLSNFTSEVIFNGTTYEATGAENSNGTRYIFKTDIQMPLISNNQTFNYTWNYFLNCNNFTVNDSITVYEPKMDDCSDYSTKWVNYNLIDEETTLPVNGSLLYEFNYYVGDYSDTFSGLDSNKSTYSFCIYPSWANLSTNVSLTYKESLTSFSSRSYSANGYTVDNSTNNVTLLILGFPSEITFHIIDASENDIPNALIKAFKYDVDTGTEQLVTQAYTDPEGKATFGLSKGTTRYRFEMYDPEGNLEINTSRFKLFSDEYQYVFYTSQDTAITDWLYVQDNIYADVYDTDNEVIHFNWSESVANITDYYVLTVTGNGTTFFSNKNYSSSGYINYTLPDHNISYFAQIRTKTSTGRLFKLDTHYVNNKNLWDNIPYAERIIVTVVLFILFVLFGISSHNIMLLLGNMIIIFLSILGFLPLGWGEVIAFIILSMILFVIMNNKKI